MARTIVAVNAQGRVTLPAAIRRELRLGEGSQLEVGLKAGQITLRPAQIVAAEDAWAYSAENLEGVRRALDDLRAGRVYRDLSEDDLLKGRFPPRKPRRTTRKGRR